MYCCSALLLFWASVSSSHQARFLTCVPASAQMEPRSYVLWSSCLSLYFWKDLNEWLHICLALGSKEFGSWFSFMLMKIFSHHCDSRCLFSALLFSSLWVPLVTILSVLDLWWRYLPYSQGFIVWWVTWFFPTGHRILNIQYLSITPPFKQKVTIFSLASLSWIYG